ncbi:hypothetical protein LHJ74_12695 [Streptomyces sp. N2-109]|uniref:Uncharacterized protein n=1 Tax=Streptomyces gossypii TaxID=2883101 RepID=A0ABT2JS96_9ACTN|nr:hypothetical protein [Streptomyces gossypii]MCT2590758.1 hypothetical protein [Streptomyces gossypii]
MAETGSAPAELYVDAQVTEEQDEPLRQVLTALGYEPQVKVAPRQRNDQLTALLVLVLPLTGFLNGLGDRAAGDLYEGFRAAVRGLFRRRGSGRRVPAAPQDTDPQSENRPIVLQDPATGLQIVLDPELPDGGYQQLLTLDLSRFRQGPVRYDRDQSRWLSDLDAAQDNTPGS